MHYSQRLKLLLMLLTISLLNGCANFHKPQVSYIILCDNPPKIAVLLLEDVTPTPTLQSDVVWIVWLNEDSYTNMIVNLHRIKAHLLQQIAVIQYYQSCIDEFKQQG